MPFLRILVDGYLKIKYEKENVSRIYIYSLRSSRLLKKLTYYIMFANYINKFEYCACIR